MSAANRGKDLEAEFRDACVKRSARANFAFHRFPDAHAGSFQPVPADFMTCLDGDTRLIEVKETKEENRLPYNNLKSDQVARMRMWATAGAGSFVLVKHTTLGIYRVFEVEQFLPRPEGQGSWFFTYSGKKEVLDPLYTTKDFMSAFNFIHEA